MITGAAGAFYQGVDYTSLESVMRMRGTEDPAEALEMVREIEAGALERINSQ